MQLLVTGIVWCGGGRLAGGESPRETLKVTVVETTEYLVNFMQIFILYYCHGDFQRYLYCFGQIWSLFFGQVWTMVSTANQIQMTE